MLFCLELGKCSADRWRNHSEALRGGSEPPLFKTSTMMNQCIVEKCNNACKGFHFPFDNPKFLKLWIAAVRREKEWSPAMHSNMCHDHFVASDDLGSPTRRS